MCVYTYVFACTDQRLTSGIFLYSILFLRQALPESLELANELDWLVSQTKGSSRLLGLQVLTRVHTSCVCAGIRSRVLMLMKQALYHCV